MLSRLMYFLSSGRPREDLEGIQMQNTEMENMSQDEHSPLIPPVVSVNNRNSWAGGYTDRTLGIIAGASSTLGLLLMAGGHILLNSGERSVQEGMEIIRGINFGDPEMRTQDMMKAAMPQSHEMTELAREIVRTEDEYCAPNNRTIDDRLSCCDFLNGAGSNLIIKTTTKDCPSQHNVTDPGFIKCFNSSILVYEASCQNLTDAYKDLGRVVDERKEDNLIIHHQIVDEHRARVNGTIETGLGLINHGNNMTALGAGVIGFGVGSFLVGASTGLTAFRRYLTRNDHPMANQPQPTTPDSESL